jgi:hypothetical protein
MKDARGGVQLECTSVNRLNGKSGVAKAMVAIVVQGPGRATLEDVPLPEVPDDYILVKTKAGIFSLPTVAPVQGTKSI